MQKWLSYNTDELAKLAAQGLSLPEISQMTCPHCSGKSMRVYIHDLPHDKGLTPKSVEWLWCANCRHQVHYRIASPHDRYNYSDLLIAEKYSNTFLLSGDEWFDFLNTLFDQHVLPQIFVSRSKK